MKKLFSLFVLALLSSQMWGANKCFYGYGLGSSSTMGSYKIFKDSYSTCSMPTSGWTTSTASSGTYLGSINQNQYVHCAAKVADATKYEFQGWYTSTTDTSTTKLLSRANPYTFQATGTTTDYKAYAVFKNKPAATPPVVSGSRSSVAAATRSAQSVTVKFDGTGAGKTTNYALPTTVTDVVDMGNAGYWRTKNVGAGSETSNGYYYQWGKTKANGSVYSTEANYTCPSSADLVSTIDAATVACGTGYCVPKPEEWNSLFNTSNCTVTPTTYDLTITSKTSGNSIVFPIKTGLYNNSSSGGSAVGCYWTDKCNSCDPYTFQYYYPPANNKTGSFSTSCYNATNSSNLVGAQKASTSMYIRPIFNLTGTVYTLTINVVGSQNYTYKYRGASGQVVNVSVQSESGYNATWNDNVSTASARQFTLTSDITKTVTYTSSGSTVSFTQNQDGWGSLSDTEIANVPSGAEITVSNNQVTINGTTITATPADATAEYTYAFDSWSNATGTITDARTITANFTRTPKNYTLTWNANGGTLTGTYTSGTVAFGTSIDQPADPTREGYVFNGWGATVASTMPANNLTYTAQWLAAYAVTYAAGENGTGTIAAGSKTHGVNFTLSSSTFTRTGYTQTGWSTTDGGAKVYDLGGTYTTDAAITLYPFWTINTYTISFYMDDETFISSTIAPYGNTPTQPAEPTKILGDDEYAFEGWSKTKGGDVVANWVEDAIVTGDQNYYAVFSSSAVEKCNLTIGAMTHGYVTLTAKGNTVTVPAAGGVYPYTKGTTIIVEAVPTKGYHFTQWSDESTAKRRQIANIAAAMTLTPSFAQNAPFTMDDEWNETTCKTNCAAATGVLTVTLKDRSFTANQWATLSVPFDYTLKKDDDDLYNAVYRLNRLTLSQDGGSVNFEFLRTNTIEANVPYLVVPRSNIETVVFYGVTMKTPEAISRTTDDRASFVSSLWKQTMEAPNDFYVATGNSLRYAHSLGTPIRGNRAFFRKIDNAATSAPRRAIMVIDGEEVEVEIAGDAIEEVQDVRKYIENGVLIIERNGVRMDAQGKRID